MKRGMCKNNEITLSATVRSKMFHCFSGSGMVVPTVWTGLREDPVFPQISLFHNDPLHKDQKLNVWEKPLRRRSCIHMMLSAGRFVEILSTLVSGIFLKIRSRSCLSIRPLYWQNNINRSLSVSAASMFLTTPQFQSRSSFSAIIQNCQIC